MTDASTAQPSLSISQLIERLGEQRDLFGELIELAGHQRALIEAGRTDELLALLGRRQQRVDRLRQIGAELEPYRDRWGEFLAALPEQPRREIRGLLDALAASQREVAAIDARDADLLRGNQQQMLKQSGRIQQTSSAMRAYSAAGAGARSRFGQQA